MSKETNWEVMWNFELILKKLIYYIIKESGGLRILRFSSVDGLLQHISFLSHLFLSFFPQKRCPDSSPPASTQALTSSVQDRHRSSPGSNSNRSTRTASSRADIPSTDSTASNRDTLNTRSTAATLSNKVTLFPVLLVHLVLDLGLTNLRKPGMSKVSSLPAFLRPLRLLRTPRLLPGNPSLYPSEVVHLKPLPACLSVVVPPRRPLA